MAVNFATSNPKGHSVLPDWYWQAHIVAGDSFLYKDMLGSKESAALDARIISGDIPYARHDPLMVQARRQLYYEQGIIHREGQLTLTAVERHDAMILRAWALCYQKAFNAKDGTMDIQAKNADYKFEVRLQLFNGYNDTPQNTPIIEYRLKRCILGDVNPGGQLAPGATPGYFQPQITVFYSTFETHYDGQVIDSFD